MKRPPDLLTAWPDPKDAATERERIESLHVVPSEKERSESLHPLERLAHIGTPDEVRAARLASLESMQPK